MKPHSKVSALDTALYAQKPFIKKVLLFSFFINLLALAPTFYMMEVYGRVVDSRSMTTLSMLTLLVIGAYVVMETLEWIRKEILHEAEANFDRMTCESIFNTAFETGLRGAVGLSQQIISEQRTVRDFLSSPAALAFIDTPFSLIFMIVIFIISPILGLLSLLGALIQVTVAYFTERDTQPPLTAANSAAIAAKNYAAGNLRNAQVIEAMGMESGIHQRWQEKQNEFLLQQAIASDAAGKYNAFSKFVQMSLGSLMLGVGCWLAINGQLPGGGGAMIVASVLGGRVMAPILQLIGSWKMVVGVRDARSRINNLLEAVTERKPGMPLPPPKGQLSVENLIASAPGSNVPILKGLNFAVPPGKTVAIVGPSACGKTSLARLLVGVWPATSGKVRLDGADVFTWHKSELGPYIGYLPQTVELFDGTIAENIARFGEAEQEKIEAAARTAGVHTFILTLPNGYETNIGDEGCVLSGGQRQRIGLARALYGNPKLLVLDEPNSNLDEDGERALLKALILTKAKGSTVLVITHRTSILPAIDLMIVMVEGQIKHYGRRDDVMAAISNRPAPEAALPPSPSALPNTPAPAGA